MQVLSSIFIFIISSYLSGVNALADFISAPFIEPETVSTQTIDHPDDSERPIAYTSDTIGGGSIPQILIENAAYQKAAVVESIKPHKATSTAYEALVNIYCEHKDGRSIKITTGTGFFIDTDGIILTNAHVAHFLLMDDIIGKTTCVIRAGNPAGPMYLADLLYISPSWVRENAGIFKSQKPTGTGERDYALLYVTGGLNGNPMPGTFPALPFDTELMRNSVVGDKVYAAGYPANALFESNGTAPLIPKLATTTIAELLTFGSNYADVFTIRGTDVGEHGSSGGPIITQDGDTVGMISTKGDDTEFGEGALRAITMSYIDRTIKEETGYNLRQNLGGDIPFRANIFNQTIVPFLKLLLDQQL